ncbi:MAG: hypothetical protein ACLT8R_00075 [Phascolarctobacterium sp.]
MKIVCMEPLGVSAEKIATLAAPLRAAGHEFVYYDKKAAYQDTLVHCKMKLHTLKTE